MLFWLIEFHPLSINDVSEILIPPSANLSDRSVESSSKKFAQLIETVRPTCQLLVERLTTFCDLSQSFGKLALVNMIQDALAFPSCQKMSANIFRPYLPFGLIVNSDGCGG